MTLPAISKKYQVPLNVLRYWIRVGRVPSSKIRDTWSKAKSGEFIACIEVDEEDFKKYYRKKMPWDVVCKLYDIDVKEMLL